MDRYLDKKSNKPIYITVVLTLTAIFALYYLFLKGPEVEHIQKVLNHSWSISNLEKRLTEHWTGRGHTHGYRLICLRHGDV